MACLVAALDGEVIVLGAEVSADVSSEGHAVPGRRHWDEVQEVSLVDVGVGCLRQGLMKPGGWRSDVQVVLALFSRSSDVVEVLVAKEVVGSEVLCHVGRSLDADPRSGDGVRQKDLSDVRAHAMLKKAMKARRKKADLDEDVQVGLAADARVAGGEVGLVEAEGVAAVNDGCSEDWKVTRMNAMKLLDVHLLKIIDAGLQMCLLGAQKFHDVAKSLA